MGTVRVASAVVRRAAFGFVVAVLLGDLWLALFHPLLTGDSNGLVSGAGHVVDCVRHARFSNCNVWEPVGTNTTLAVHVGPWPLLQYLPAVLMRTMHFADETNLRVLIALNALSLFALVGIGWRTLRRVETAMWAPVFVAAIVASPLLWYGTVAFGEALAATVVAAAVAAMLFRSRPWLIAVLVASAGITKETNPIFVAVLVLIVALSQWEHVRSEERARLRDRCVAAAIGTVGAVVINTTFNVFRFGSVRNTIYTQPFEHAPNVGVAVRAFGGVWFAPNGGLLFFWPVALAVIGLTVLGAAGGPKRAWTWTRATPLLVAGTLVALVGGLSTWYSPFGWIGWGPRLTLTVIPAMLLITCVIGSERSTKLLSRILPRPRLLVCDSCDRDRRLPQVAAIREHHLNAFFGPDPHCVNAHVGQHPTGYYNCITYLAWQKRPFLLQDGLHGLHTVAGLLMAISAAGAIISLMLLARAHAHTVDSSMAANGALV